MKRVLRSTFDPEPGPLSTTGLMWLVAVVLLGTAVTVHRYLESSGRPSLEPRVEAAEPALVPRLEVRAAPSAGPRAASLGTVRSGGAGTTLGGSGGASSSSAPAGMTPSPSCFQPEPQ